MRESEDGLDRSNYSIAMAEMNISAFGQMLTFFKSDIGSKWLNPIITDHFTEYLLGDRISVITTDNKQESPIQLITIEEEPSRVAVFLNGNYCIGFMNRRSQSLVDNILDTASVMKRAVEQVSELQGRGVIFMNGEDYLESLVHISQSAENRI